MLLTINNLPSHTRYTDVKALIQSKCGPLEVILDNLVTKNKFKSVTVGLADEGDAAILVRKMNGLFMDGVQIYVEDPRQNKRKEQQPFRSSETFSQPPQDNSEQLPLGFQNLGAHAMEFTGQPQGVMPMMPFNQSMMTYGMPTYGMYVPQPGQNAGFMGYGQPMMQNMPGGSQMQNQNLYENLDMSNTFQGANQEQRNDFVQGTGDYQPDAKKSRRESEHKQRSEHSDRNPRFRDRSPQNNRGQQDSRNSKHRKSGFNSTSTNRDDSRNRNDRPSFANQHARKSSNVSKERYSGNRSSHNKGGRTSSQQASNYKGSGSEIIPSLFDIPPLAQGDYREQEKMNYEPHYNENPNWEKPHDHQYRDRPEFAGETRNPSLLPEYGQRSAQPEPHFADNSEAYQDYRERQYEAPFETNRDFGREPYSPTRIEYDNYEVDRPKPLDPWASDNNFDRHVPQKRTYDDRERRFNDDCERRFNDDPYDTSRPGHRQNDWADNRSKNFDDSRRSRSKFHESEEVRGDWRNQNPPQRDPKPSFTRRGEPGPSKEPRSFQDRRSPLRPQFKPRDDRRGPRNMDGKQKPVESKFNTTRTGGNRPVAPNTERSRSLTKGPNYQGPKKNGSQKKLPGPTKPEKPAPKPQSNQQPSLKTLINKDATYRGQATSQIAKEMINNLQIHKGESHTILKPLKLSIRARLELILGENMVTSVEEVVEQYRQKFSEKEDAAFFDIVLQKYEEDQTAVPSTKEKANGGAAATTGVSSQESQKKPAQPPAKPSSAGKIPKFPNADKNVMKQQKKNAKMEFSNEDMYELQEPLKTALKEEIDAMCELFNSYECADEDEKKITNIIKNKATKDFRKAVQLNATKRILNINTNLLVRIFVHGKLPKADGLLNAFLKDFGVESCRKNKSGTFFVASCETFDSYDKLLTLGSTNLGGCNISIKPLHLAGFKSRPSKDAVKKSRAAFIRRQIEDVDQSNAIEDSVECNDNPDDFEDY